MVVAAPATPIPEAHRVYGDEFDFAVAPPTPGWMLSAPPTPVASVALAMAANLNAPTRLRHIQFYLCANFRFWSL